MVPQALVGQLRAHGAGPADLGHRPLQLPLHLLHARRGHGLAAASELLTYEEIERVARVCVERFGFDGIRLTGGEPTVRAHLPVAGRAGWPAWPVDLAHDDQRRHASACWPPTCAAAGLHRINISCDSLRPERFLAITRRDALAAVLDGIDAALEAGFDPVKVNCVLMRGVNDDEIVDFATFGRERGVVVRFIEFMPLDASRRLGRSERRAGGGGRRGHRRRLPARAAGRARQRAGVQRSATATAAARSA